MRQDATRLNNFSDGKPNEAEELCQLQHFQSTQGSTRSFWTQTQGELLQQCGVLAHRNIGVSSASVQVIIYKGYYIYI